MSHPTPPVESFKVDSREKILEQIEKFKKITDKVKEHKVAAIGIIGDGHKEFFDRLESGKERLDAYAAKVEAAAGNEEECKKLVEEWNAKIEEKHAAFFGELAKIRAEIEAKFPGGYEAFRQKQA